MDSRLLIRMAAPLALTLLAPLAFGFDWPTPVRWAILTTLTLSWFGFAAWLLLRGSGLATQSPEHQRVMREQEQLLAELRSLPDAVVSSPSATAPSPVALASGPQASVSEPGAVLSRVSGTPASSTSWQLPPAKAWPERAASRARVRRWRFGRAVNCVGDMAMLAGRKGRTALSGEPQPLPALTRVA